MKTLLISACLLGVWCRYDGGSKPQPGVEALAGAIPADSLSARSSWAVCRRPGLPASGRATGWSAVEGRDVTAEYRRGAEEALRLLDFFPRGGRGAQGAQPVLREGRDLRRQLFRRS